MEKSKAGRKKKDKVCKTCGVIEKIEAPVEDKKFYVGTYGKCIVCLLDDKRVNPKTDVQLKELVIEFDDKPMVLNRTQELREMYYG